MTGTRDKEGEKCDRTLGQKKRQLHVGCSVGVREQVYETVRVAA